jgi:hypothetical protein
MEPFPRLLGLFGAGGVLVASEVVSYHLVPAHAGFRAVDVLHYAFFPAVYALMNLAIDEGRARERASREGDEPPSPPKRRPPPRAS